MGHRAHAVLVRCILNPLAFVALLYRQVMGLQLWRLNHVLIPDDDLLPSVVIEVALFIQFVEV